MLLRIAKETRNSAEGSKDLCGELQGSRGSRGESDEQQTPPGKEGEGWKAAHSGSEPRTGEKVQIPTPQRKSHLPMAHHQESMLALRWTSTSSWTLQVLASELSLIAFILLLVMVFSKKWLYLSRSRFYQRWPANVSAKIHTKAQIMSMGLLHICKSRNCHNLEHGKVTFIFFTLMLFPINLWIFEWKNNLSIPIGWSYFVGWLVFFLYVACAILCYFNQNNFWSLVLTRPFGTVSCSSLSSAENFLNEDIATTGRELEAQNLRENYIPVPFPEGS
ncbi:PREDICTED: outer dense fiber protein 4-like [Chrysochloris asiatica]|uniref:Outer dense fiber protein 4-like n=1 Tax=Chrysochloris asiatica TaxID=185453 RepID=A0A9B0T260_CHRAS|nr:PREDICTED: outer dense fiber protein 4-like [Chrysochloris asiatica]